MLLSLNFISLAGIMIAATSLFMGTLMFSMGKDASSRIWGLFCLAVLVWGGSFYFIASTQSSDTALLWWKVSHVGVALMPALFLHFVYRFLQQKRQGALFVMYAFATCFLIADIFTNTLVGHMRYVFNQFYYDSPPGFLYPSFFMYFQGVIIYAHYLLFRAYRATKDENIRQQIKHFFMGTFIGFLGGGISFAPVFGIDIYPATIVTVTLYPIIMGYAILRFRLFNFRVVAAQIVAFVIFVFSFTKIFNSSSISEFVLNVAVLAITLALGLYLVKSVTKEIEQRELIQIQEKDLEIANAKQKALLYFISHEIKGYFTKSEAVFASIIEGDFGEVSPKLHNIAQAALVDARKGVVTVMDILDASSLERGTVTFKRAPLDFRALVMRIIDEQRPIAYEKQLSFDVKIDDGAYQMEGDEEKLREHVVRNLIDNAIKYTPEGSIRVELSDGNGKIRFVVQDSGIGISPEDMAHLFTEGGRGKDSIKVNVHSTGYGLFIAKEIVRAHGGKIWAETGGSGKGSRFIVEFTV